jgi:hypothetical protein
MTVSEFEGQLVNYALVAVTSFQEKKKKNHMEPNQVSKLGRGAKSCF